MTDAEKLDELLRLAVEIRANQAPKNQRVVHFATGAHELIAGQAVEGGEIEGGRRVAAACTTDADVYTSKWRFVTCLRCLKRCPNEKLRRVKVTSEVPL